MYQVSIFYSFYIFSTKIPKKKSGTKSENKNGIKSENNLNSLNNNPYRM